MKLKNIKTILALMMLVLTLASCSESDGDQTNEFANWQAKSDQAFADTLAYAKEQIANGKDNWKIFPCWSMDNRTGYEGNTPTFNEKEDNIVVQVLDPIEIDTTDAQPLYTDSVEVSYKGMLLPSASYPTGYVFDSNFTGTYDKDRALTTKFAVKGLIDGFTTALLKMEHIGTHWMVYIPYNLGYGSSDSNSSIPAYSMLRFEIILKGTYKNGKWIR